ncbi:MAG: YybH family protein [Steroidobacteraceae bacterium]
MKLSTIRPSIFMLCASVAVAAAAAGSVRAATPTAERAIRPIMARMLQAANAHDTSRFMAPYLHAPSLVFVFDGMLITGWKPLYAQQLKWWNHGKSDWQYSNGGPREFMKLAPGVELTTWRVNARRVLPGGKVTASALVVSYVWKRLPRGWRIVYGHESWANPPS